MSGKRRLRLNYANVAATIALVAAVAGTALASIPAPGGVIKACYKKSGGALRVIDTTKKCAGSEKALNWNNKGPSGISQALSVHVDGVVTAQGGFVPVAKLNIPAAGSYVAFAKAWVENTDAAGTRLVICHLTAGNDLDSVGAGLGKAGSASIQTIALNVVHVFTKPGTVNLECGSSFPVEVAGAKVTALRVGELTNTAAQP